SDLYVCLPPRHRGPARAEVEVSFTDFIALLSVTDFIALLALLAAIVAAYFAYPAWHESRLRPCLRLLVHAPQGSDATEAEVVRNADQNQVVFGLVLHNDGKRDARFWRVAFKSPETHAAMVYLGDATESGRSFRHPSFYDRQWITEATTANPAARLVPGA